jgi:hypothetical protein
MIAQPAGSDHAEMCLGHVITGVRGTYDRYECHAEKKGAYIKHWPRRLIGSLTLKKTSSTLGNCDREQASEQAMSKPRLN